MYPVLFEIGLGRLGTFTIGTYGLFYALGFLAGLRLAVVYARREGIETARIVDLGIVALISGFLGAKVVLYLVDWRYYFEHPFEMAEVLARLEALLRRGAAAASTTLGETYRFGDICIDLRKAEVTRAGQPIELSAREFKLLRYFVEHRGAALSRDELLNEVWGYNAMPSTRTVDVHVAWLRQRIEDNPRHPQYIHTVHGLGYKFVG